MHHDRNIPFTADSRPPQESDHRPGCRSFVLVAALACMAVIAMEDAAFGGPLGMTSKQSAGFTPKDPLWDIHFQRYEPELKLTTTFEFHPPITMHGGFMKNFANVRPDDGVVMLHPPIKHEYKNPSEYQNPPGGEDHGTTGSLVHTVYAKRLVSRRFVLQDQLTHELNPGFNPDQPAVSITSSAKDPLSFGDAEDGAAFESNDAGFDVSYSLLMGTRFATESGLRAGTIGSPSSVMAFTVRVAPGVINDPDEFWGTPDGAIDLFSVRISSDTAILDVDLYFGESTDQFMLNYYDSTGVMFDPADPLAIAAFRQQIVESFIDGSVKADLEDLFTVGFVPLQRARTYTLGYHNHGVVTKIEVPTPGSLSLLLLSGILASHRRRCALRA